MCKEAKPKEDMYTWNAENKRLLDPLYLCDECIAKCYDWKKNYLKEDSPINLVKERT